jgi:hypothetical protein
LLEVALDGSVEMIFTSTGADCTSTATATTGSFPFPLELPFTMLSMDDAAN